MQKVLAVLGVLAVVLAVTAGASATARSLITGANVENESLTGSDIRDRSLHFGDFSANGESMIRQGWRLATGKDRVRETMLDPALATKINAPQTAYVDVLPKGKTLRGVIAARRDADAGDTLWAGVTFPVSIPAAFTAHVIEQGHPTAECGGTYVAPTAAAGHLCIYLGGDSANAGRYAQDAMGSFGFRFAWRSDHAGQTSVQATYAFTAA